MMPGVILAGWCDGGPLAGKQLAHYSNRYRVPVVEPMPDPDDMLPPRQMREQVPKVVDGEYVWDDGAWRWKEQADDRLDD